MFPVSQFLRSIDDQCGQPRSVSGLICRKEDVCEKDIIVVRVPAALHVGTELVRSILRGRYAAECWNVSSDGPARKTPDGNSERCAAALASRISQPELMVTIAAGLLSTRNSNCSSASRRADTSASILPQLWFAPAVLG